MAENLPFADTLDAGRLDQFERQRLDEVAHEQRTETGLERDVEQRKSHGSVVHAHADGQVTDRHHQDLGRNKVPCHENEEQDQVRLELVDCQGKTGQARQADRSDHGRDRHLEAIEQIALQIGVAEHSQVVVERQPRRDAKVVPRSKVARRADRRHGHAK